MSSVTGKLPLAALAAVAVVIAACGGSTNTTTTAKRQGGGSRPTRLYAVRLSGGGTVPGGARGGRGVAVIAFHGESRVCWRFAHLHGFTDPTAAHIHTGRAGRTGPVALSLSRGTRLHHKGCAALSPTLTKAIWSNPTGYYVDIHSTAFPNGAVRGQL